MIKVAISGAASPMAGELVRILVNHPDVEIVSLFAPGYEGKPLHTIHHGLLGEENLSFTGIFKPGNADILFITDKDVKASDLKRLRELFPELKVVLFFPIIPDIENTEDSDIIFALPEINRKPLVRGAKMAILPNPLSSLALVPLYPMAVNMLLSEDITLNVSAPEDIVTPEMLERSAMEIEKALMNAQLSFQGKIKYNILPPSSKRGIELKLETPVPVDVEFLKKAYEIYDDHHFAFALTTPVKLDDVKGTEKIIFSLQISKDGILSIHSVADGRLRGSAGEAVHVMNLMFGLHEKTGLYLKPYAY